MFKKFVKNRFAPAIEELCFSKESIKNGIYIWKSNINEEFFIELWKHTKSIDNQIDINFCCKRKDSQFTYGLVNFILPEKYKLLGTTHLTWYSEDDFENLFETVLNIIKNDVNKVINENNSIMIISDINNQKVQFNSRLNNLYKNDYQEMVIFEILPRDAYIKNIFRTELS